MRNSKLTKFIPVDNNINKAVAFANTLDVSNIRNIQRIKTKEFYIPTLDVIEKLQDEGWQLSGVNEQRGNNRKITNNYVRVKVLFLEFFPFLSNKLFLNTFVR